MWKKYFSKLLVKHVSESGFQICSILLNTRGQYSFSRQLRCFSSASLLVMLSGWIANVFVRWPICVLAIITAVCRLACGTTFHVIESPSTASAWPLRLQQSEWDHGFVIRKGLPVPYDVLQLHAIVQHLTLHCNENLPCRFDSAKHLNLLFESANICCPLQPQGKAFPVKK